MLTCSAGLLFLVLTFGSLVSGHNQVVETVLYAKWKPTSILSEAGEYIGDIDPTLFWKFLDAVFDRLESFPIPPADDEAEADLASISAFNLISPAKLRMMEWSLTSRAYSPRVYMLQELTPPPASIPPECDSFVHVGKGKVTCDLRELEEIIRQGKVEEGDDRTLLVTDVDHKYPSFVWNQDNPAVAVLYGHVSSPTTKKLHNILKSKADEVGYVFRPYRPNANGTLVLSGYGVELQFKSTEYKAQDDTAKVSEEKSEEVGGFIFDKLHELHPDRGEQLEKFQNHLTSARGKKAEFAALKAWQVQELGLQASHYTTLQEGILDALMDVSGNFPSRAASLSSIRVPSEFKKAVFQNQKILQSHYNIDEGDGAFFLQGNYIDTDSLDLFTFMDSMQTELDLIETLRSIYHETPQTRSQVESFLQIGSRSSSEPDLALDLRDSSVFWVNDLEKDEEYEDWPDDLTQLFFRMGGVMLRPVRRNVFNLLFTLNPEDSETTGALLKLAHSFLAHKAPLRVGVVFCSENKDLSNSIEETKGEIIRRVFNYALSEEKVRKAFNVVADAYSGNDFSTILKKFGNPGEEFDFGGELACEFVKKSGRLAPGAFLNGIPLKWESVDDFEEIVLNQLLREAQSIQIEAYNGKIRDSTDIFEYLMNKPNIQSRLNDKILDTTNAKYVPFGNEIWEPGKEQKNPVAALASTLNYLVPPSKRKTPVSITLWVLADVSTPEGHSFLQNSVEFLQDSSTHSRIAFVPTDTKRSAFKTNLLEGFAENDLKKVLKTLRLEQYERGSEPSSLDPKVELFLKLTGFPTGGKGLVVNGRIIGPLSNEETFDLGDWALVEKFSYDSCAKYFDNDEGTGDTPMRVCSAMSSPKVKVKNSKRFTLPDFESAVAVDPKKDYSNDPYYLDLKAVVDPASRNAHKMAAILTAVQDTLSQWVRIQIIFNPPSKHSELPLKSYFRYVAGNKAMETVIFEQIPRDPLFTQNLIAPDNWMVEVVKGEDDLDNIRLSQLSGSVTSEFELANLLVEGHCLELKTGSPPRGVQFTLTSEANDVKPAETIVMANLGYFQLKAQPGVWQLSLREGPSKEIFAIEPVNMKPVVVQSFQSVVVKVKVKRNPGKESVSLLDSEEESNGSWFGFGNTKAEVEDDTINVFSLASGHLYERLLKIMMLSVMKNTKSKVKFWFLKNYLSPSIKDVLPDMAKEYGFEYELIQYHWPRWLNPQREKQRMIWGYKILFLDVLFPLSLKKFVFVDADQIVRADLKELFDLDLEGNPYGYTPFCDSRVEMEGFRFWKQGYWRSHLGKRKYHISALYVVDLVRFRRIAAGDRLRGQYQALSQDPNSLSNLDQDLPNNMIHQVGIKSLPQEWLWCETWCDDGSKAKAKTIDLCNNPQTKESKLDAAQRIVSEWKDYDQEITKFQQRLRPRNSHDEL